MQCLSVFFVVAALWLVWLTTDPITLTEQFRRLAADPQIVQTLLSVELGPMEEDTFSFLDRLLLAQSPFLTIPGSADLLSPPNNVQLPPPAEPSDPDEPEENADLPPTSTTAPEDIIPKTMVAGTSAKYINSGTLSIYNHTSYSVDIDALLKAAPELSNVGDAPLVLIYHSHATEAYTMDGSDLYEESDSYRTLNTDQNMVRIGREIAQILESSGVQVIHDTTLYDYPRYSEAYTRSGEALAKWLEQYPSIQLVIDVHRDALAANDGTLYKTVAGTVDDCAQIMMVMGSDAGGTKHPNWKVNLSLALSIQKAVTDKWATLARPIVLRTSRFNQQQSTGAILVEFGTHGNTLQEAITAARLFGRTLAEMITT
jgi:stage II sporulation protein P